jgi:hypothetical protein
MELKFKERKDVDRNDWRTVATWPDCEGEPAKDSLVRLGEKVLRVVTSLRTGPTSVTVYVEPTWRNTLPGEVRP